MLCWEWDTDSRDLDLDSKLKDLDLKQQDLDLDSDYEDLTTTLFFLEKRNFAVIA